MESELLLHGLSLVSCSDRAFAYARKDRRLTLRQLMAVKGKDYSLSALPAPRRRSSYALVHGRVALHERTRRTRSETRVGEGLPWQPRA
jgi:hypothetical protein